MQETMQVFAVTMLVPYGVVYTCEDDYLITSNKRLMLIVFRCVSNATIQIVYPFLMGPCCSALKQRRMRSVEVWPP